MANTNVDLKKGVDVDAIIGENSSNILKTISAASKAISVALNINNNNNNNNNYVTNKVATNDNI